MQVTAAGFAKVWRYAELFKQGLIVTVSLSALTVVFGFVLALILAILRLSKINIVRFFPELRKCGGFWGKVFRFNPFSALATVYVELFRATPMLVQILLIYHVVFADIPLPSGTLFGFINLQRFIPGVVALSMNSGAYLSEIIRAGIQSIDGGQTEGARSLGLTQFQNMRYIILPQAIKNILPAVANEFVTIIKESAITYTIGVQDIMYGAKAIQSASFRIAEPLVIATALYFCLTFPTSKIIAYFERRMSRGDKR